MSEAPKEHEAHLRIGQPDAIAAVEAFGAGPVSFALVRVSPRLCPTGLLDERYAWVNRCFGHLVQDQERCWSCPAQAVPS
jgi:hypothetical protein